MTKQSFLKVGFAWLPVLPFCAGALRAQSADAPEKAKIESLITHLENLGGATFIRNGSDYDPKTAAKFLRGKWKANDKEIKTAADFIARAASVSGTTGKPYVIRLKDGTETPCAAYLTAQLKNLEAKSPKKAGD